MTNIFHRPFLSCLLASTAIALSLSAAEAEKFFPVMPWNSVVNDKEVLTKIHDCGFTVAGFVSPEVLKTCQEVGLKGIVQDPRIYNYDWTKVDEKLIRTNVATAINGVRDNPALYGFYLRDEPNSSYFPGLATVSSIIHEMTPDKWAYINLFPNYANNDQLGSPGYEAHLENFIATCHPTQLSYDHYALMDDGSLRDGYWKNLEQMRNAAKKHNLPFWNIVLAVAHFNYREPTAADLRFEVYSSLAYGVRGIAYFTYFTSETGNYRGAAIDQFGHPTPTWANLQNVNLQIQKLAPTLLELTSDGVYHFGTMPNGCNGPATNSLVKNVPGDFAVGDFTHKNGTRYVMLVNKNVSKSNVCSPQFRNPVKAVKRISPYSGQEVSFDGEQVWVAPGHGVLLKLE